MQKKISEVVAIEWVCDILGELIAMTQPSGPVPVGVYYNDDKGRVVSTAAINRLPYCFRDNKWLLALLDNWPQMHQYPESTPRVNIKTPEDFKNGTVWVLAMYQTGNASSDLWNTGEPLSGNGCQHVPLLTIGHAVAEIRRFCVEEMEKGENMMDAQFHLIQNGMYVKTVTFGLKEQVLPDLHNPTLGERRASLDDLLKMPIKKGGGY